MAQGELCRHLSCAVERVLRMTLGVFYLLLKR